ncbi:MAG: DNA translocase FtsK [Puniceicoccales bacterium]|jgi:S-DNA-T family DNA segregation ATPase FtsK/SpoIIIE|nr:DNA translocase FtsK [Puniceicoccales bacterium]
MSLESEKHSRAREVFQGIILFVVGLLMAIALFGFDPNQSRLVSTEAIDTQLHRSLISGLGISFSFWVNRFVGFASFTIPLFLLWFSSVILFKLPRVFSKFVWIYSFFAILALAGLFSIFHIYLLNGKVLTGFFDNKFSAGLGGIIGTKIFDQFLMPLVGLFGSFAVLLAIFLASAWLIFRRTKSMEDGEKKSPQLLKWIKKVCNFLWRFASRLLLVCYGFTKKTFLAILSAERAMVSWIRAKKLGKSVATDFALDLSKSQPMDSPKDDVIISGAGGKELDGAEMADFTSNFSENLPKSLPKDDVIISGAGGKELDGAGMADFTSNFSENLPKSNAANISITSPLVESVVVRDSRKVGDYVFPGTELLERGSLNLVSNDDHEVVAARLVNILAEFGVSVRPSEIHRGPVITRYEILPEPGVRVEKIVSLDKNIALGLAAKSVRIIAPVPGKSCVGVELPNREPVTVRLREILESKAWAEMRADIPIVLGRGVTGEPIIADLAKMPHLLIAGSTGSGKTVCINAVIASLLFHGSPDDLRFIMVDPKIVEMQTFNDLPHMLIPVVTDPKKVPNALKWLISEMENRYQIFAKVGVRNIASFNAKICNGQLKEPLMEGDEVHGLMGKKMPYIVCIIDELADLMMVAPGDIETCIARLAQLARAAGIHLILATQRPSVNVITGIIKANLPSRIAFKVASKVDSRTILDVGGAESLLGQGDMLFLPPGSGGLLRAQGALVSDDEINAIVRFLHATNGAPKYEEAVQERIEIGDLEDGDDGEGWEDNMIPKALEIIRSNDKASISFLQRKLKIGYNRAARIMDTLKEKGLVPSGEDIQD